MKKYVPWIVVVGLLIAGLTAWYVYSAGHPTIQTPTCPTGSSCPEVIKEARDMSGV